MVFLSSGELCKNYTCGMKLLKCPFATNIGDGQGYLPIGASFISPSLHGLEVGVGYGSYLGIGIASFHIRFLSLSVHYLWF